MAKWGPIVDYEKKYKELKKKYDDLKDKVTCDYYEAYLLEKLKREALEEKIKNGLS